MARTNLFWSESLPFCTAKHPDHFEKCDSQTWMPAQEMLQTFISRRNVSRCKLSSKGREFGWYWSGRFLWSWRAWLLSQWWCFIGCCRRASLSCWGTRSFPDTLAQGCDCSQSCTQMAQHGLSCPCLRIARSPTCVLVRKGAGFLPIKMGNFTWCPIRVTSIHYGGMSSSNGMATQFLAILNRHGNVPVTRLHLFSCRRVSKVPESPGSFGLSSLHGALSSAVFRVRFSVHPIWELQQH